MELMINDREYLLKFESQFVKELHSQVGMDSATAVIKILNGDNDLLLDIASLATASNAETIDSYELSESLEDGTVDEKELIKTVLNGMYWASATYRDGICLIDGDDEKRMRRAMGQRGSTFFHSFQ